jgi:hypothetical protein
VCVCVCVCVGGGVGVWVWVWVWVGTPALSASIVLFTYLVKNPLRYTRDSVILNGKVSACLFGFVG